MATQTTTNTYIVLGQDATMSELDNGFSISIPIGPTKIFQIDHLSAYLRFNTALITAPVIELNITLPANINGVAPGQWNGQHYFPLDLIVNQGDADNVQPRYVLSRQLNICVTGGVDVEFSADSIPQGASAIVTVTLSGRYIS